MARHIPRNIARAEERQARLNRETWAGENLLDAYASTELRPVEARVLERYSRELSGRVLELGCGGGRITGHLARISSDVHAIDISEVMIDHCRSTYPEVNFSLADLRDLGSWPPASYEAVLAPFNVLDVLGDDPRRDVLIAIHRLLTPGGLLIFSSHNRAYADRIRARLKLIGRLVVGSPARGGRGLLNLGPRIANRVRLRRLERSEERYAVINDEAHDFSVLHYYISRDDQERQLEECGFELLECMDLAGETVLRGRLGEGSPELHYAARA